VAGERKNRIHDTSSNGCKTGIAECFFQQGNGVDPYVSKARERAKNKIRNCIIDLNRGRPN
jgi:hypothetical protein